MSEPRWLKKARSYIGLSEISGRRHNTQILQWWTLIRAGFTDDETPWCAAFVGGVLEACGIKSSRSAAARSYLKWGQSLGAPRLGCIVVFERGPANGHVGFVVGRDQAGRVLVLGGNQGDAVNIKPFPVARVLGYRWPPSEPMPADDLPVIGSAAPVSRRESFADLPAGEEDEAEPTTLSGKIKHWFNAIGAGAGTIIGGMFDWRVAAVFAVAGVIVFCIIWFTHMRKRGMS